MENELIPLVKTNSEHHKDGFRIGIRHGVAILTGVQAFVLLSIRNIMTISLVSMANFSKTDSYNVSSDQCPNLHLNDTLENTTNHKIREGEFNWDANMQGQILASFYYGYVASQIPGGYLADKIGAKKVLCMVLLVSSTCSVLSPVVAHWSVGGLIALQAMSGLAQGPLFPAFYSLVSKWSPENERSVLLSFSIVGANAGFGSQLLTGYLDSTSFLGGWPAAFYLYGGVGLVLCVVVLLVLRDEPSAQPCISTREVAYIERTTRDLKTKHVNLRVPVVSMLLSLPVWAMLLTALLEGYTLYVLSTPMPLYFREILKFSITENSLIQSIPAYLTIPTPFLFSLLADYLRSRYLSTGATRKLLTALGDSITIGMLISIGLLECQAIPVVYLFTIGQTFGSFNLAGANLNSIDIAPMYSGTLTGFQNMLNNIGGILAPVAVQAITKDRPSISDWKIVFFSSAGVMAVGIIIFVIFGSGKEQPWAKQYKNTEETKWVDEDDTTAAKIEQDSFKYN